MDMVEQRAASPAKRRRRRIWPIVLGGLVAGIVVLALVWDWNWFRPLVEAQASAALGRRVTIGHFDLKLGRMPTAILDDVEIANPDGFDGTPYLAHVGRLSVTADALAYLRGRDIVLPRIEVDRPDANVVRLADGRTNYALDMGKSSSGGPGAKIGELVITDGHAHVVDPALKADFGLGIATRADGPDGKSSIVVDADGTYAGQKITGQAVGGALLSLRDASDPYPIDAHFANGATKVELSGTVRNPLAFAGANLTLHLAGLDMAGLTPLSGIPIPRTPPYDIAGKLDYADKKIRFSEFKGRLGSSDIGGTIAVNPTPARPVMEADLSSRSVDLADLGGLIGSQPGRADTPGQTAEQKQAVARAEASSQLLPNKPISLPALKSADIHLRYKGDKIAGKGVPFDTIAMNLDIVDGAIHLHPISLGVGRGQIAGDTDLVPAAGGDLHAKADIHFDRVDVGRMLAATGMVKGAGLLGGRATIDATGNSLSALVGHGDGGVQLMMQGGNLSALIVNLSGLQFGKALLSALGLPDRATLQCLAADLALQQGVLKTKTLLAVTSEADILVDGSTDLRRETLDFRLRTESRHFAVGSLPTDIQIKGTFKDPGIMPNVGELAARGGAAVALGVLLTPLGALLPTVQFGTGDDNANACAAVVQRNGRAPK